MFRIVGSPESRSETDAMTLYMSQITSESIIMAMDFLYKNPGDEAKIVKQHTSDDFFAGIGKYYDTDDDSFACDFIAKKAANMRKILEDPDEVYSFDVIEDLIFFSISSEIEEQIVTCGKDDTPFTSRTADTADTLSEFFGVPANEAKLIAIDITCPWQMGLYDDEGENAFFWDRDYELLFSEGFVSALSNISGFGGTLLGYGYECVLEMFEEIGYEPPYGIIGAEESDFPDDEQMQLLQNELLNTISPESIADLDKFLEDMLAQYGLDEKDLTSK